MRPRELCLLLTLGAAAAASGHAQTTELHATAAHKAEITSHSTAVPATVESEATLNARIIQASSSGRGELWLAISAESLSPPSAHLTLRIPLSSTEDVYGESRSCKVSPGGAPEFTFTAGMDENNFLPFAPSATGQEIHLSLNKYVCRAFAAPFHCNGSEVGLPSVWSQWRIAGRVSLSLSSDAPATAAASQVNIKEDGTPFDPATCAVIAPSNGLCCVAGKTTEWHCGGTPVGSGWHQVSGECFHRETGGSCSSQSPPTPAILIPPLP